MIANPEQFETDVRDLMALLRLTDPTGTPGRHPEWPYQITAAEDAAPVLVEAFTRVSAHLAEVS